MNKCADTDSFLLNPINGLENFSVSILGIPANPLCSYRIMMKAQPVLVNCDYSNSILIAEIKVRFNLNFKFLSFIFSIPGY